MHCCTTTSTSTLATSTAIRPRGNAAHFLRIPVISLISLFSVFFSFGLNFAQNWLCGGFWSSAGSEACLAGFLGAGRAQRRNEENRGGTPENRGDKPKISKTDYTRKGETRETRRKEAPPALTPARPGAPSAPSTLQGLQVASRPYQAVLFHFWCFFACLVEIFHFQEICLQYLCGWLVEWPPCVECTQKHKGHKGQFGGCIGRSKQPAA